MKESDSRPGASVDSRPPLEVRDAITQSVITREASRALRLQRTLEMLLALTRSNPPTTTVDLDRLLGTILDALMVATEAPMGNLQLFDPASHSLHIHVHRGFKAPFLKFFARVHEGAACSAALAKGAPEVVDDVATSPLYTPASRRAMLEAGVRAVQSLALVSGERKLGAVSVHYASPGIPAHKREAFASAAPLIVLLLEAGRSAH